jgi:hypothetical protein
MPKFARFALVLSALAVLALSSSTVALADNGVNVSVVPTATLTAKLEIGLTVTTNCPSGWLIMQASVSVEEAVGKSIAHGTGYIPGVQCTGTDQVIPVTVIADSNGPHFKNGTAIVTATLYAYDYLTFTSGSATVNTAVKLH